VNFGYRIGHARADLSMDRRDSAALTTKPEGALLDCEPPAAASALAARRLPGYSAACFIAAKGQ